MIASRYTLLLIALILPLGARAALFSSPGTGDPTSTVLPAYNDAYANWANAGLAASPEGSITTIDAGRAACTTAEAGETMPLAPSGKTPPTTGDDADNINQAISDCPSGSIINLASGTFQISQSEYVALNASDTLRGNGSCTNASSPYCNTVLNVYNGAIADWTISSSTAGANCGVTSSSTSACTAAAGVVLMSPSANYNWGWAGGNLNNDTPTSYGTALTADATQGQTTIQVASTSNFSVGMWVLIAEDPAEVSTTNPTGGSAIDASPEFLNTSGAPAVMRLTGGDIPGGYSMYDSAATYNQWLNQEIHIVKSIGTGTLTFDDPLTIGFRESGSHDARVYWPTVQGSTANPFLQYAGVEDLTITKAANGGVQMTFCAYCWVRNVEVGGWIAGAVDVGYSVRDQIDFNYFHDCYDCENNGNEYPIGIDSASTEVYADNNIIVRGGKGMVGRDAAAAVVAYNYVDDTFYMQSVIGDYWIDMDVNGSHYAGTHHFLFEGNWGDNCDSDETHGNATYHVFFRNDCTGIRTTFTDPSDTSLTVDDATGQGYTTGAVEQATDPRRAAGPMAFDYWFAFVGNVLGLTGVTTTGGGWTYDGTSGGTITNKAIWLSGWVGSEWPGPDKNLDGVSNSFIFRHGDYDYVNADIDDWTTGYSHTLPNSFYLSSEPSFFSTVGTTGCIYAWPWVTPTGASPLQTPTGSGCSSTDGLPAKARYDAGTPFVQP